MIEITRQYIPPPPPPPQTVHSDLIQIVEDNTLEEEVEWASIEDFPDEAIVMTYGSGDITEEYDPDGEVFMFVEEMPGFPGGESALMKFINDNLRYPQLALENGISGRVICTFVIDGRGKVSDIQVIRSVDPNLDREATRVISMMPDWKPGKQRGKPVRVRYTLPIIFKLQ
jgi:protein TonB